MENHENAANVPEVRAIEDFWSILKDKVYEKGWVAKSLDQLKNRIRYCWRNMDLKLVYDLLAGTSSKLSNVRMYGLIENRR